MIWLILWKTFCVYEQKSPILRGRIFVTNRFNPVECTVNSRFKFGTHLVILTKHSSFWARDLYHNISRNLSPCLTNCYRLHNKLFVKWDQVVRYKFTNRLPRVEFYWLASQKKFPRLYVVFCYPPWILKHASVELLSLYRRGLKTPKCFARPIQLCSPWCLW